MVQQVALEEDFEETVDGFLVVLNLEVSAIQSLLEVDHVLQLHSLLEHHPTYLHFAVSSLRIILVL